MIRARGVAVVELVDFLVIVPTHKRREQLRTALRTIFAQTGITKKVIVADDCPEGSAEDVVIKFDDVIYIRNPLPSGGWPGRVRNFALKVSQEMGIKAAYVHFLDDDDTVPEGHYALVKDAFAKNPRIGVIFGVLRPFCVFSENPNRQKRQYQQLKNIRNWRREAGRFPWLYQKISSTLGLPFVTYWLLALRARFGPEMFLCSGGVIRYEHVLELGGFPDIRITQDYFFYTEAIIKFRAMFLGQETAGYGVGDAGAIWNPLSLPGKAKLAHVNEWKQDLAYR
jgi:glycosyltransferase involved in cell wall biosynthesis